MTLTEWVNDPIILGNDPIFEGSWRLQASIWLRPLGKMGKYIQ